MHDDEERQIAREKRRRRHLERLGLDDPRCPLCGEDDVRCLELDHIAGRAFSEDVVLICASCHRKRTDLQKDHPPKQAPPDNLLEIIGRFLLGVADFFELLIERFRQYGEALIRMAADTAG